MPAEGGFQPYARDDEARASVGQAGHARAAPPHRRDREALGTGNIDYSPDNHQAMTDIRQDKVLGIDSVPTRQVELGETGGKLAVVGWGSTFGPIHQAVRRARARGLDVSHIHIRHIWPMPQNLGVAAQGLRA